MGTDALEYCIRHAAGESEADNGDPSVMAYNAKRELERLRTIATDEDEALRDEFAGRIAAAIVSVGISMPDNVTEAETCAVVAGISYDHADALMTERERRRK